MGPGRPRFCRFFAGSHSRAAHVQRPVTGWSTNYPACSSSRRSWGSSRWSSARWLDTDVSPEIAVNGRTPPGSL